MAMRQTILQRSAQFDPHSKKDFRLSIPEPFLQNEPNPERILRLWKNFESNVNRICKASKWKSHIRETIIRTSMEKCCLDFSRCTETLKIRFETTTRRTGSHKTKTSYQLNFVQLSGIPEACRDVQFCAAEIPVTPQEAVAELVSTMYPQSSTTPSVEARQRQTVPPQAFATHISTVRQVSFDTDVPVETVNVSLLPTIQRSSNYHDRHLHLPVAMAAPVAEPSSALERMQELESIKSFLTTAEFSAKRQAILDCI